MNFDPTPAVGDLTPVLPWNPEWETGESRVDDQHRELLRRMEHLLTAVVEGWELEACGRTLTHLQEYVDLHFRDEEALMEAAGAPDLAAHRAIHAQLRAQVSDLVQEFRRAPAPIPAAVMDFLHGWLVDHLSGPDRRMAGHLRAAGRRA